MKTPNLRQHIELLGAGVFVATDVGLSRLDEETFSRAYTEPVVIWITPGEFNEQKTDLLLDAVKELHAVTTFRFSHVVVPSRLVARIQAEFPGARIEGVRDPNQRVQSRPNLDFISPVKREVARLVATLPLIDAPEFSQTEYWFARQAYRTETALLFFDCELDRDYGVDVMFGVVARKEARHSFHTFLRLYEPAAALELGRGLPKDQRDMDDLLRLYVDSLLKHRKAIFKAPGASIVSMERNLVQRDFVSQRFDPVGRFCRNKNELPG